MTPEILNIKKDKNAQLRKEYPHIKNYKAIALVKLENKEILQDLKDGLSEVSAGFIIEVKGEKDLYEKI